MALNMREELKAVAGKVEKKQAEHGNALYSKCFALKDDFLAFQGHFPGHPTLPAVVQIMMAEMTIAEALHIDCTTVEVKQAKFLKPITPNHDVYVNVLYRKENTWDCEIYTDTLAGRFRLLVQ